MQTVKYFIPNSLKSVLLVYYKLVVCNGNMH